MKKSLLLFLMLLAPGMLAARPVYAGYAITQSSSSMHGVVKTMVYIQRNKYKTGDDQAQMVINFATNRVILTDENNKTYWEGSIRKYGKAMADMKEGTLQKMREMLKKMPESERKQIMEMHGMGSENKPVKVGIQRTKQTALLAGHRAEKFIITDNGSPVEELWITRDVRISDEIDPDKLQKFNAGMQTNRIGSTRMGRIHMTKAYRRLFKEGYPLKQVFNNAMTVTVDSIKKTDLPEKIFTIPAGYRRIDSFQKFYSEGHSMMD